jgi:hypothetical protein
MTSPASDSDAPPGYHCTGSDDPARSQSSDDESAGNRATVRDIVEQLEKDSRECWHALEGLWSIDPEPRFALIGELAHHTRSPGVLTLLRLLATGRDTQTRARARTALAQDGATGALNQATERAVLEPGVVPEGYDAASVDCNGDECLVQMSAAPAQGRVRVIHCLITPVDGRGRGSVVVSVSRMAQRRTAAFLCDVRRGIRGVLGDVEPESMQAGGLLDDVDHLHAADCVRDVPGLAIALVAGNLLLCGPAVPAVVRDWLDGTLGCGFQAAGLPAAIPGLDPSSIAAEEIPARVRALLDACPSWLDDSPLTLELAEEIRLREGRSAADPKRDAGAYRFLFEHRLIHRLELYRRMLFWMAWLWSCSGRVELARSALAVAAQLSDEQYAVPSHPFTVELTTRSLKEAQERL